MTLIGGIFIAGLGVAVLILSDVPIIGLVFLGIGSVMLLAWYRGKRREYGEYVKAQSPLLARGSPTSQETMKVGDIRLDFLSRSKVVVTDTFPVPTSDAMYLAAFPFMFAVKMLYNFPPPKGNSALRKALSVLPTVNNDNIAEEFSFLGMCSEEALEIVEESGDGKWVDKAEMYKQGQEFGINAHIAYGDEDHFHRASIDAVFEWFKRKWELGGSFICPFVKELFSKLDEESIENLSQNYGTALETGVSLYVTVAAAKEENQ